MAAARSPHRSSLIPIYIIARIPKGSREPDNAVFEIDTGKEVVSTPWTENSVYRFFSAGRPATHKYVGEWETFVAVKTFLDTFGNLQNGKTVVEIIDAYANLRISVRDLDAAILIYIQYIDITRPIFRRDTMGSYVTYMSYFIPL